MDRETLRFIGGGVKSEMNFYQTTKKPILLPSKFTCLGSSKDDGSPQRSGCVGNHISNVKTNQKADLILEFKADAG